MLDRRSFLNRVATMATALSLQPRVLFLVPPAIYEPTYEEWCAVNRFCSECVAGHSMTEYLEWCVSLEDLNVDRKAEAARHLAIIGPCVRAAEEKHGLN